MKLLKLINLAVAFILELCLLAILCYAGFKSTDNGIIRMLLAIGLPGFAVILWGLLAAPKAPHRLEIHYRIVFELLLFGSASLFLYATGHLELAYAFAAIVVINQTLAYVWKQ